MDDYQDLWNAITVIQAEEQILSIQATTYPHTSKDSQNKIYKAVRSAIKIDDEENMKEVTLKDLGKILVSTTNG